MTPRLGPALRAASLGCASAHVKALLGRRRPLVVAKSGSTGGYPGFSSAQLNTLLTWGGAKPPELGLSVVTDHMEAFEKTVVFRHDEKHERYLAYPTSCGTVVLIHHSGARWELPTLDTALAKVVAPEQERVDA